MKKSALRKGLVLLVLASLLAPNSIHGLTFERTSVLNVARAEYIYNMLLGAEFRSRNIQINSPSIMVLAPATPESPSPFLALPVAPSYKRTALLNTIRIDMDIIESNEHVQIVIQRDVVKGFYDPKVSQIQLNKNDMPCTITTTKDGVETTQQAAATISIIWRDNEQPWGMLNFVHGGTVYFLTIKNSAAVINAKPGAFFPRVLQLENAGLISPLKQPAQLK